MSPPMVEMLVPLTHNAAPLLALVVVHAAVLPRLRAGEPAAVVLCGLLFGAAACVGMAFPFELDSGVFFDGRTVVLSLSGFFGGPAVAAIAAVVAAAFRIWIGGAGTLIGVGSLLTAALIGTIVGRPLRRAQRAPRATTFLGLGLLVHLCVVLWMLALPEPLRSVFFHDVAVAYVGALTLSNFIFGLAFQTAVSRDAALRAAGEAEGRFRTLVEGLQAGVYLIQDRELVYASPALEALLGYRRGELAGRSLDALVAPADRARVTAQLRACLADADGALRFSFLALRADGRAFQAEALSNRTRRDGQPAVVGTLIDADARDRAAQQLAERERLLREAQRAGRIGSFALDVASGHWTTSEEVNHIFGITLQTPHSFEHWLSLVVPEQRDAVAAEARRLLRSGPRLEQEYAVVRAADGERRWVHTVGEVERDAHGRALRIIGVVQDITERKEAELALQRTQALHEEAQKVARIGHWELDHASGRLSWSEQTHRIFERNPRVTELTYAQFLDSIHPEDRERLERTFTASIQQRIPYEFTHRLGLPDGRLKYVEERGETFFGLDGRPQRSVGTVQDVTERVRAKLDLAHELRISRMILDTMSDGHVRIDRQGRILDTNHALCQMLGYESDELVGRPLMEFKCRGAAGDVAACIAHTTETGPQRLRTQFLHKDGRVIDVEVCAASMPDADPPQLAAFFHDVTRERRVEAQYQELVSHIPAGVFRFRTSAAGERFEYVSPRFCALLDVDAQAALADARTVFARVRPDEAAEFAARRAAVRSGTQLFLWDGRIDTRDGSRRLQVEAGATAEADGERVWHGVVSDISERQRLLERSRLDSAVIESTAESIIVTDLEATIVSVNRAFCELTGYSAEEVVGQNARLLKSGRHDESYFQTLWQALRTEGRWQGQIWNRRKSGELYPSLLNISAVRDPAGRPTHYVGVATDISLLKRSEEQLLHLAHHDALTGLPNRLLVGSRIEHALERARRDGSRLAVLFLDLDRFKNVNDSLGHPAGDELLVAVAARLKGALREEDTLGRLGGDEFLLLLERVGSAMAPAKVAQNLLAALAQPFRLSGGHELYIQASIGISLYPADGDRAEILIRNADAAMFRAKDQGRNTYHFYTKALTRAATRRLQLETRIRRGIETGEFRVHYQPIFRFAERKIVGAEALIRWQPARGGMIPPDEFIPVAEDSGLIIELGRQVLQTSCADLRGWLQQGLDIQTLAVNLSAEQFHTRHFEQQVADIIAAAGVPARILELELTERGLMDLGRETLDKLNALKQLGVSLAIDDFGTGYSSLTYLKRMPVNKLKIDRSFVEGLPLDASDAAIVRTIVAIARSLQLMVLAEGVETAAQQAFLLQAGCDECQGFLFGRAVPAAQFAEQMRAQDALVPA